MCGNEEAMNSLRDWLHLWHERLSQCRKSSYNKGRSDRQDASEDIHQGPLQSVLLITGPIGVRENIFFSIAYQLIIHNSLHC